MMLFAGLSVKAQHVSQSENLKLTNSNNEILMEWKDKSGTDDTQWVIQASENGKDFNTIGYVWGADPGQKQTYKFKQKLNKISQKPNYVKVWKIQDENLVLAAEAKSFSK